MSDRKLHPFATPTAISQGRFDQRAQSRRSMTPNGRIASSSARLMANIENDPSIDEDPRLAIFKDLYNKSEARLATLFNAEGVVADSNTIAANAADSGAEHRTAPEGAQGGPTSTLKRKARAIDEDDYGDDDSDGEDSSDPHAISPLKSKGTAPPHLASSTAMLRSLSQLSQASTPTSTKGALPAAKTTEAARKKLEEDKKATEDAAKLTFHTLFYTLENDRDAMLEQRKLEELERKVEAELGGPNSGTAGTGQTGSLSQANLGASSLTLKNLIRRIDEQRDKVQATDTELRSLMSEVKKNRSKWASEEKVGQEELYESFDKVLSELKGHTEHSTHFLNKVNKKDAPDYGNIIKHPMDLGTMTKKLKNYQYRSKREFVDDLMLIWSNCLKYNANPDHYMRKHALAMRRETEKLVPLIPDIVIRDRAEVEAEERRQQRANAENDGDEDSDDEPIISSRGRKAPSKTSKKGVAARKAPSSPDNDEAGAAPASQQANGQTKDESIKPESEAGADGSQTPPPGIVTPATAASIALQQGDAMDLDGDSMINGIVPSDRGLNEEPEYEDLEYKTWKQVTKKDRALVTSERHNLFKDNHLDPEAPALLRSKAKMRKWLHHQKKAREDLAMTKADPDSLKTDGEQDQAKGETLAEEMEDEEEKVLPDYYDPLSAIPSVSPHLQWTEDSQGHVHDTNEEFLHALPLGQYLAPTSSLTKRIHDNVLQIQRTRKITAKIGVVKQMALQTQLYSGQFQKTELIPLNEQDIEPHVATDDGPIIAPVVTRAALQRSIAELLVQAGFEEFQPSALDAFTDLAGDYFHKLSFTLAELARAPKVPCAVAGHQDRVLWKTRYTSEEQILHSLKENGTDLDALDVYVNEDIDRLGTRLVTTHERMKTHLADLLRPALQDAGPDGSGAFNDGSDQFVSGDFAEELGDDFFGFKELGLVGEFGGASMSVPLHLLQKSMFNANQTQSSSTGNSNAPSALPAPEPLSPVTVDNVSDHIGLVQQFFLEKLRKNDDQPLVEDDELPIKQRMPKPRLPPNGKITSPRKRPYKEPGPGKGHPRKKMKPAETDPAKQSEGDAAATNGIFKLPEINGGEAMSREPSKASTVLGTATTKPLLNSLAGTVATTGPGAIAKAKGKLVNGDSGHLPSPESMEAS